MKTLTKKQVVVAVSATAASLALPLAALAAFGPDRQTYVCGTGGICQGANHVQFNSFTNNPVYDQHDERNFLTVRPAANAAGSGYVDSINLTAGQEYVVRAYVHNNADQALAGTPDKYIAKNTTFKVSLPGTVNGSADATGHISASNALPGTVYDTTTFKGNNLKLNYVAGSAKWSSNGSTNGAALSDSVTSTGALLGFNSLNGDLPGCFEYSGYVSFKVKAESIPTTPVTPQAPPVTPAPPATPAAPVAPLPETGPELLLGSAAGASALGYATLAYRRSRRAIAETLLNRS